jgi:hypothetical protein
VGWHNEDYRLSNDLQAILYNQDIFSLWDARAQYHNKLVEMGGNQKASLD